MKKLIILTAYAGIAISGAAQQLQTSSFYELQAIYHNPSTAGANGNVAGASYRTQWSNISGAPKTATAFASFDLPDLKIGLGGYVYNDQTGPTSRTGVQLAFAKHIPMNNGARFSLGIEARGLQYSIDRAKLSATLGSDPALGNSDNKFKFDAGFGISYTGKKLQVGVAATQLVQSKLDFYTEGMTRTEEGRLYRHYYFHSLYNWAIDDVNIITPHVLFTYLPNAPLEFQGGVRLEHNQLFWVGMGMRLKQSITASAGLHIHKKFTVGYSFDVYRNPVSIFDNGGGNAHEVLVKYSFKK